MVAVSLEGVGVALVTPFKKDCSIDYNALSQLIEYVIAGGCDYIVSLGTTAETPTLEQKEKEEIAKFVSSQVAGRVPLVIGIGGYCTHRVVNEMKLFDLTGYSAILSVTPSYNKPTQEGLFQHFKTICDNSPLPLILYNVPSRTCVNLTAETTLRLARYSTKIIAIKEASGDMKQIEEILKGAPETFSVISGNDSDIYNIMQRGGKGVISVVANAFPKLVKNISDACLRKDFELAKQLQEEMAPIVRPLFADGNPSGIKALLSRMGFIENVLRLPLVPVSEHVDKEIRNLLLS